MAANAVSPLPEVPTTELLKPPTMAKPITPPATTAASTDDDYEDVPSRQHLTFQALANTSFLHPLSSPVLVTSRDPATNASRILILSSNPSNILFSQPGTSLASYEALLQQTEVVVHSRLEVLNPEVEGLRSAVDTARLQRENTAMLEALERSRATFTLQLPTTTRKKSTLAAAAPIIHQHKAHLHGRPLPKSHRFKKTELSVPALEASEMVSPRTIPTSRGGRGIKPPAAASKLGNQWGDEADSVAAWIREVSEAELTPPLTPGAAGQGLPKSKRFEGRAL
jgi:hypothetical protein